MGPGGPKWGQEHFFWLIQTLPRHFGRTYFDFENSYFLDFVGFQFPDFQIPKFWISRFPNFWISRFPDFHTAAGPKKKKTAHFWGHPKPFFAWAGKVRKKKKRKFCIFSLVGQWALFNRFGPLAAQPCLLQLLPKCCCQAKLIEVLGSHFSVNS